MIQRRRDSHTDSALRHRKTDPAPGGQFMSLEEFWDFLADETEAMSGDDLCAELDSLRVRRAREVH